MMKRHTVLLFGLLLMLGCRDIKMPENGTWKGIYHLSTKGDQTAEASFDFKNHSGLLMMPEIIPVPLELSGVKKQNDSLWFTIGFRSGPARCKAKIEDDSIRGIMIKEGLDPSPFWLAVSTESISIFNQPKPPVNESITITTENQTETELATQERLERVLSNFDLEPYLYTKKIHIQDRVIPHSHPILTISTRDTTDDLILSTFIHEQMHWYTLSLSEASDSAIHTFMRQYPEVPTELPEGGGSEKGTYLHLLVNYLEYHVLIREIGPERAKAVMDHWSDHHYTWIYKTVLNDFDQMAEVVEANQLHFSR